MPRRNLVVVAMTEGKTKAEIAALMACQDGRMGWWLEGGVMEGVTPGMTAALSVSMDPEGEARARDTLLPLLDVLEETTEPVVDCCLAEVRVHTGLSLERVRARWQMESVLVRERRAKTMAFQCTIEIDAWPDLPLQILMAGWLERVSGATALPGIAMEDSTLFRVGGLPSTLRHAGKYAAQERFCLPERPVALDAAATQWRLERQLPTSVLVSRAVTCL